MEYLVYNRLKLFVDVVLSEYPSDEGGKANWMKLKQAYLNCLSLEEDYYAHHDIVESKIILIESGKIIFSFKSCIEFNVDCTAPNLLIPKIDSSFTNGKYKEINNYFCEKFNTFDTAVLESEIEITDTSEITFDTTKQEFILL